MERVAAILVVLVILEACLPAESIIPTQQNDKLTEILSRGMLFIAADADNGTQSTLLSGMPPAPGKKCSPVHYIANQMTGFDVDVAGRSPVGLVLNPALSLCN